MARVATPAAGGPHQITVTEGAETLTVEGLPAAGIAGDGFDLADISGLPAVVGL